jgi:phenylacetate-coenzyme A ligase PaaK-like adenylate-forming protein
LRFKNQVNIINKAEAYIKSKGIKTKKASFLIGWCLTNRNAYRTRWLKHQVLPDDEKTQLKLYKLRLVRHQPIEKKFGGHQLSTLI